MNLIFLFSVFKIHTLSENHSIPSQLPFPQKPSDYTMTIGKRNQNKK
ncbi:hypothetical protein C8C88_1987 [Flavobacterium sp. 123]|nr:hypothetical protein C8C88_1987 [Flavobacterium sp. 123]